MRFTPWREKGSQKPLEFYEREIICLLLKMCEVFERI